MIRAYLAIFVWGVMLILLGIPVLLLGLIYPSRRVMAWSSGLWARTMLTISGVRLTVEGLEPARMREPSFYLGNHQSALDIPLLIAALQGDVRFMAKSTLFRTPIFGWIMARYGYIPVDRAHARNTLRSLEEMIGRLRRRPISLAVFPEGTRTQQGELLPFRKGTMKICRRAGLPVVPFAIDGAHRVNPRNQLRAFAGPVRLSFGPSIPADEVVSLTPAELHDRVVRAVRDLLGRATEPIADDAGAVDTDEQIDERGQRSDIAAATHP